MFHQLRLIAIGLGLIALLAACTTGSGASAATSAEAPAPAPSVAAPSVATPSEAAPSVEASAAAGGTTIALAENALGAIIVDAEGKTLYLFKPDEEGGEPTCYDQCEDNWPPLVADGTPTAGEGLDAAKLTTVARTDGTMQVKYGEYPLYYFAGDAAAGETNGQGLAEGAWLVLGADGEGIQ